MKEIKTHRVCAFEEEIEIKQFRVTPDTLYVDKEGIPKGMPDVLYAIRFIDKSKEEEK